MADTLALEKSMQDKLPSFADAGCLVNKRAFEQCTSEDIANYKASLFEGSTFLDLSGGLGVDDWAFSKKFKRVISIEPNIELNNIINFNFNKLNISNIDRIKSTAEDFLQQNIEKFDCIYLDPDRRSNDQRQILLSDHVPNCITLLPHLLNITTTVIIKCSPLYDYEMAFKELINIKRIFSISRKGEMKELLIECTDQNTERFEIICTDCNGSKIQTEVFDSFSQNNNNSGSEDNDSFFYEVGASIVKVRQFNAYGLNKGLNQINKQVPYFTSKFLVDEFIGRKFNKVNCFEFSTKTLKQYLKANNIAKINLKVRGLNYSTDQLKHSLNINEGGEHYFFVLPNNGKTYCYHCKKID